MTIHLAQLAPSFIVPGLAVAGAVAVSIPIIIHILSKRPRKPEPWAAMRFLLAAYRKHRMRTRLEQWILLAMRCLLLVLLGMALAGPIWSAAGALAGLGAARTVLLVLDNSVTSGAVDAPGHTRLTTLQDAADKLLASLGPGDRAALITASRPATALIAPPTADPAAVRSHVRQLAPSPAAADLPGALRLAGETLRESSGENGRTLVVLLSDFSAGAVGAESEATASRELAKLGDLALLVRNEPLPPASNVQITSFEPDQRVVLAQSPGQSPSVNWTLRLRRQTTDEPAAAAATVRLKLLNGPPIRRTVSFEAGQEELELSIATLLNEPGLITVEASLEPAAEGADSLSTDNMRYALVGARQKMAVLLIGDDASDTAGPFTPQRWLTTALAPASDRLGWPIDVRSADPPSVGTDAVDLAEADAAIVLRPDQLTEEGFAALRKWSDAGGLTWFIAPAATGASQLWPQRLVAAFGLPWSISQETVEYPDENAPLRLKTDTPAIGEIRHLGADLADLLRPVELYRRLTIDPASLGAGTQALLSGSGDEPILIGATTESGRGRVLLLATAMDPEWTNLPAKPLLVPLLHESLRAAIDRVQPSQAFEPGDRPALGPTWEQVPRITAPDGEPILLVPDKNSETDKAVQGPPRPIRPLGQIGVYRGDTDALVVNVKADAADTRAASPESVRALLDAVGPWRSLNLADPAVALQARGEQADISWPLLWAVLALAIAETLFARKVSHASTLERTRNVLELTRQAA